MSFFFPSKTSSNERECPKFTKKQKKRFLNTVHLVLVASCVVTIYQSTCTLAFSTNHGREKFTSTTQRWSSSSSSSSARTIPGGGAYRNDRVSLGSEEIKDQNNGFYGDDGEYYDEENDEERKRQRERKKKIESILKEQDEEFKRERKQKQWGRYANATNIEELKKINQEESEKIKKENDAKIQTAKQSGINIEILSPKESFADDEVSKKIDASALSGDDDSKGYVQINSDIIGSNPQSWFKDVDEELKEEWQSLQKNGLVEGKSQFVGDSLLGSEDNDEDEETPQLINGKMKNINELQGVRVGSSGGWTLEIYPGDYVVHRKYGIGKFEKTSLRSKTSLTKKEKEAQVERRKEILTTELRKLPKGSVTPDDMQRIRSKFGTVDDTDPISNPQTTVLEISYADATVHVPVDKAYRLSRYRAGDAVIKPKLSRAKGEQWGRQKSKVKETTLLMAQDVLALYATRETLNRIPYDPERELVIKKFEKTFPFVPTRDQQTCFEQIENDMVWRSRPMDRLVCGDVGFGKTEVALRALFRTVVNGRQAALLAPTGVLSAQHFKNALKRMGPDTEFNINIVLLRGGMGKNTKVGKEIRQRIASGEAQLIIGTHALLTQGTEFHNLGLLVVDEEQRFGVKQKERIKLICNGIDVLTLSATPIPRTLQMSLSGIRDTSTIRSPPPMRKPTISYVQPFNDDIVYQAISTELNRGGQCYYVVPRIAQISEAQELIESLFPDIRVIQAHGRMGRGEAEENVADFAEGNYDILLATTVIENGVDIPSVNTIIIQNSQNFGMSALYQLRGRVGRSDVQAYAYFLHREEQAITEQAAQRLTAMGELNELGCGFDVANRDLEIRGAGSLLGTEQSGMASKVGFDLYMRMLKKSIRQLRGLDLPLVPRTNIILPKSEGSIEVDVSGDNDGDSGANALVFRIPEKYIRDDDERTKQETDTRLAESTNKLVEITKSWKDTYGPIPSSLQKKLKTMHLHACTRRLGIDLVGLVDSTDDDGNDRSDCILRSPGLRPRHWVTICQGLPNKRSTKGLNVIFPPRFVSMAGEDDVEIIGGTKADEINDLMAHIRSKDDDTEEEEWDALDQEEVEAMKEISSSINVKDLNDIDIEQYPRFVVPNLGSVKQGQRVDYLLKLLLPATKMVYEKQEKDKENARLAAELREKRENMKKTKKKQDSAPYRGINSM